MLLKILNHGYCNIDYSFCNQHIGIVIKKIVLDILILDILITHSELWYFV